MDILKCKVCFDSYNESERRPLTLDCCGHSFCKKCVDALSTKTCPECRSWFLRSYPNFGLINVIAARLIDSTEYKDTIENFNQLKTRVDELSKIVEENKHIATKNFENVMLDLDNWESRRLDEINRAKERLIREIEESANISIQQVKSNKQRNLSEIENYKTQHIINELNEYFYMKDNTVNQMKLWNDMLYDKNVSIREPLGEINDNIKQKLSEIKKIIETASKTKYYNLIDELSSEIKIMKIRMDLDKVRNLVENSSIKSFETYKTDQTNNHHKYQSIFKTTLDGTNISSTNSKHSIPCSLLNRSNSSIGISSPSPYLVENSRFDFNNNEISSLITNKTTIPRYSVQNTAAIPFSLCGRGRKFPTRLLNEEENKFKGEVIKRNESSTTTSVLSSNQRNGFVFSRT